MEHKGRKVGRNGSKECCETCEIKKTRDVVGFPENILRNTMQKASFNAEVENCGAIPPLPTRHHGLLLN
jgi:hypothetical protein